MRKIKLLMALALFPALLWAQDPASSPVAEVVELDGGELPAVVVHGSRTRAKYLLRPGTGLSKDMGIITTSVDGEFPLGGRELGSIARTSKPFLVKEILLSVRSNHIPGCVAAVNIYRIEGKNESLVSVLHRPLCFEVGISDKPRKFHIRPEEVILLEPGRYFIAFHLADYDRNIPQTPEMTMDFNIYMKSSYLLESPQGKMDPFPVNIGLAVKGLEYR